MKPDAMLGAAMIRKTRGICRRCLGMPAGSQRAERAGDAGQENAVKKPEELETYGEQ